MIPFDQNEPKMGIYDAITSHEYHRVLTSAVSNSYLGRLSKCPAKARVPDKDTDSLLFGRALHAYALDRDQWAREFAVLTEKLDLRKTAHKEFLSKFESENIGKQIVHIGDFEIIKDMHNAIMSNSAVASMLAGSGKEVTIIWQDTDHVTQDGTIIEGTNLWCKTRPDVLPSNGSGVVLDLKTTRNAAEHAFQTAIVSYGYDRQAAMALHGLSVVTGKQHDIFGFIAVEAEVPYRTELYVLDDAFVRRGFSEFKRLLRIEKHCREQNYWPNYSPTNILDLRKVGAHTVMLPGYLKEDGVWEMQEG